MIYPIVIYGAQTLRNKSENITPEYPDLKKLIDDMFLTLDEASGVGLAAPQIGKNIRLFIVDCTPWADDEPSLQTTVRYLSMPRFTNIRRRPTSLMRVACRCLACTRMFAVLWPSRCVGWMRTLLSTMNSLTVFLPALSSTSTTTWRVRSLPTVSRLCVVICSKVR